MTSRSRLLAALQGRIPDRVPISTYELSGYNSRAFENREASYKDLMNFIRQKTDCMCMWNPDSNEEYAKSSYAIKTEVKDVVEGNKTITHTTLHTPRGALTGTQQKYDNVYTTWNTEHFCKTVDDVDAYLSIPHIPVQYDYSDFSRIKEEVGDKGVIMASLGDPACLAMEIMEFGEATVWALTQRDHFEKTIEELHRRNMINLENMLNAGVVDLYRICGPEYITPPYLPPAYFKSYVAPYIKDMTSLIHRYGGMVRIHSHGKIQKVLDMILNSGADAIDPCEAPPDGDISLAEVKMTVGDKMTICGNLQLKLLEHASIPEIIQVVKQCMDSAKEGGRYIIMPTASPINIPLSYKTQEGYRAFIETAIEYGKY